MKIAQRDVMNKAMQAKGMKCHLMTSLAPAERQLASMAADNPTATACCPIFFLTRLSSRETGTSGVSTYQRKLMRWKAKYRQGVKSTALTLAFVRMRSILWSALSLYRKLSMPTPVVPYNTGFLCGDRWWPCIKARA